VSESRGGQIYVAKTILGEGTGGGRLELEAFFQGLAITYWLYLAIVNSLVKDIILRVDAILRVKT
jgi:hypothetical protein